MNHHAHPASISVNDFKPLTVSSTAFKEGEWIPEKYTCDGANVNPPLHIEGIPENTKCLAIIVDDPDAPVATWLHWIIWNIPVTHHYKENTIHGSQGLNDFQKNNYSGPCPPPGKEHRYYFKIYALDELILLPSTAGKKELEATMSDLIIAYGVLTGLYKRKEKKS
ncbi:MAG: YbhB/YbcL family Raf kinase inhibitor-like protein [Terrimonas sp.]|nr:YbhB/YbcL family Raf kinase inhibitor-like protein [Terrimonas sp.]